MNYSADSRAPSVGAILCSALLLFSSGLLQAADKPAWWGNAIGKDEVVLPGFEPVSITDKTVSLGVGRSYVWGQGLLPEKMTARGTDYVSNSALGLSYGGREYPLEASSFDIIEASAHHAIVETSATVAGALSVKSRVTIEYDGLAQIEINVTPLLKGVTIDSLFYRARVHDDDWTKMLAFQSDSIHKRQKKVVFDPSHQGDFLSAVAFTNGERSFWWFVDHAKGWGLDIKNATHVERKAEGIYLQQSLLNTKTRLSKTKTFTFNLLLSPVKIVNGNIRANRYARRLNSKESKYHGVNIWWTTAFVHQVLPYTEFPEGVKTRYPIKDQAVYPGLSKTRQHIKKNKRIGIDRIPYFSAHMLNRYDPAYERFRADWELYPKKAWTRRKYDTPYTAIRDDPYLTHRAEGYTDYLIYRFDQLVDELDFEGLYFDQGGVVGSKNPAHDGWLDSRGKRHAATDILPMRNFHKRLATLLHLKDKKAVIYSHNSNTVVLPAYSFVTEMVQGEEYIHWLKDFDYIASTSLDVVRSRLGSQAFGVPGMWLEVIYAQPRRLDRSSRPYSMSKKEWLASSYYDEAYQNFMALVLLHDMSTWAFAPIETRNKIFAKIDWLEPETARFVGYWNFNRARFSNELYHSYYLSKDKTSVALILSNLGERKQQVDVSAPGRFLLPSSVANCNSWEVDGERNQELIKDASVEMPAKRFKILALRCMTNAD